MGFSNGIYSFAVACTASDFDPEELSKRLWGDLYFDPTKRTFSKKPTGTASKRYGECPGLHSASV